MILSFLYGFNGQIGNINNEKDWIKPVVWVGTSLENLKGFPNQVQREFGYALYQAQIGERHHKTKPLKGFSSVVEIVSNYALIPIERCIPLKLMMRFMYCTLFKKNLKGEEKRLRRKLISSNID